MQALFYRSVCPAMGIDLLSVYKLTAILPFNSGNDNETTINDHLFKFYINNHSTLKRTTIRFLLFIICQTMVTK